MTKRGCWVVLMATALTMAGCGPRGKHWGPCTEEVLRAKSPGDTCGGEESAPEPAPVATQPAPVVDPEKWLASHGQSLDAALDAAAKADVAYHTIADTPITAMDDGKRKAIGELVSAARDAYRRAKSFEFQFCDVATFRHLREQLGGIVRVKRQLLSVEALVYVGTVTGMWLPQEPYGLWVRSSRGKLIMALPTCRCTWSEEDVRRSLPYGTFREPPAACDGQFQVDVAHVFQPILWGDRLTIDDLIVRVQRGAP